MAKKIEEKVNSTKRFTRSLKLRINPLSSAINELLLTHQVLNRQIRYWVDVLLTIRQAEYTLSEKPDMPVSGTSVKYRCTKLIEKTVKAAQGQELSQKDITLAMQLLRTLYEIIVPASVNGNAPTNPGQHGRYFIYHLASASSEKGLENYYKIQEMGGVPDCIEPLLNVGNLNDKVIDKSNVLGWGLTDGAADFMSNFKKNSKWVIRLTKYRESYSNVDQLPSNKELKAAKIDWVELMIKKVSEACSKETEDLANLVSNLRNLKVIPLIPLAPIAQQLKDSDRKAKPDDTTDKVYASVSKWDSLAFDIAVSTVSAWETQSHNVKNEYANKLNKLVIFEQGSVIGYEQHNQVIKQYEANWEEEYRLSTRTNLPDGFSFNITGRMIKLWPELKEKWRGLDPKKQGKKARMEALHHLQEKRKKEMGDANFYSWLAEPEQYCLWCDTDYVTFAVKHRKLLKSVAESKEAALLCVPDPYLHPKSAHWEFKGNNFHKFNLSQNKNGWQLELKLLCNGEHGLEERDCNVGLYDSLQMPKASIDGNKLEYEYHNHILKAEVPSVRILLDRGWLESLKLDNNQSTSTHQKKKVKHYVVITLNCLPIKDTTVPYKQVEYLWHARSLAGKKPPAKVNKWAEELAIGTRFMTVDLGLRSFAHCSIYEVSESPLDGNICFEIDRPEKPSLYANKVEQFELCLNGENPSEETIAWRERDWMFIHEISVRTHFLKKFKASLKIHNHQQASDLVSIFLCTGYFKDSDSHMRQLNELLNNAPHDWGAISKCYEILRDKAGELVNAYKQIINSEMHISEKWGLSIDGLKFWDKERRVLKSWSMLDFDVLEDEYNISQIVKRGLGYQWPSQWGAFGKKNLHKQHKVKKHRMEEASALLIAYARGARPSNPSGKLVEYKKDPCDVIIFEDLSRYITRYDRPRSENGQLMQWSHRTLLERAKEKAELWSIKIHTISPEYSSRYDGVNFTPGMRCFHLTAQDCDNAEYLDDIRKNYPQFKGVTLLPGMLVPRRGGEHFATVFEGNLVFKQADFNAADQLANRFFTRFKHFFKLRCRQASTNEGSIIWVPVNLGKRLLGTLGYGYLIPETGTEELSWVSVSQRVWNQFGIQTIDEADKKDEDESVEGIDDFEFLEDFRTFFTDPSGQILPKGTWLPSKEFWGQVNTQIIDKMLTYNQIDSKSITSK
ncbi:type V CRISPR-associated protein Cas12b [Photobacterium sp. ZSDE20]|uniref:Type V CRISPR-associated protein Cas12b n=1 Tax=Photobacterium pectinilyticum TaxID=2906793 RepID=A0ABT1N8P7_9GAMM|nr:type V CRISPR-associated protein Cas12b [Photobacterium sp. ZSDE20]MCQ1061103.1 type V CRISPR-associated protein Cas12b [Photobacterium sp. ZSDE20]MDD1829235.1 type V CRISPR-associated protein Cas12b [Photobacterium sp. ZSDE20]